MINEVLIASMSPDYAAIYKTLLSGTKKSEEEFRDILQPHVKALREYESKRPGCSKRAIALAFYTQWQEKTDKMLTLAAIAAATHIYLTEE